jgi:hypothetical protein
VAESGGVVDAPRRISPSDVVAARRLVLFTIGAAALASGLLEYAGLGIAAPYGGTPDGSIFWAAWARGSLRTLGGAVGLGMTTAGLAGLGWRRWQRPLRLVAAGFALGTTSLLVVLALLTNWAP